MNRAVYTVTAGGIAALDRLEAVAQNLANASTAGYKAQRLVFRVRPLQVDGPERLDPVLSRTAAQVVEVATVRDFSQGPIRQSGNALDVAIEGDGLFQVTLPDGNTAYTRSGALKLDAAGTVVTSQGDPISPQITIPQGAESITIGNDGTVSVLLPGQTAPSQVGQIQTVRFANPAGLRAEGSNLFRETDTSGTPTLGTPGQDGLGKLSQGFLESSNVSVVEELVAMITGQRAYEINSRAITAADEMLRTASSLGR